MGVRKRGFQMRLGFLALMGTLTTTIVVSLTPAFLAGQAPAAGGGTPPTTSWGETDLQGIWTDEYTTPMERPVRYAGREFLTEAEIAEQDKARAARVGAGASGTLDDKHARRTSEPGTGKDSVRGKEIDVVGG